MKALSVTGIIFVLGAICLIVFLVRDRMTADDLRLETLDEAITDRNTEAVRRLSKQPELLEARDQIGGTPLISACSSGQFLIAEILIASGADMFAASPYGVTAGELAWNSRVSEASSEGQARKRILQLMKEAGWKFPPPTRAEILDLIREGKWPSRQASK